MGDEHPAPFLVARVVGSGIRGEERPLAVPDGIWEPFLATVCQQRLTGLALAAVRRGSVLLTERQEEKLVDRHRRMMLLALALERALLRVADTLRDGGIQVVVLKGPALAHSVYADPSDRPFGDLDLLVRAADWRRTSAALAGLGYTREVPEPRPGFDERFGKAATHRRLDGLEVDLHRRLVVGPFGLWIQPEELFDSSVEWELGGRKLRRFDRTALLLHACVHATLGSRPPLLLPLRDVAQIVHTSTIDWARLVGWAKRWRLSAVLELALEEAARVVGIPPWAELRELSSLTASRTELRAMRAYTTGMRARGGTSLSTLSAIPGARAKMDYARALLLPDAPFLEARTGSGRASSHLRRWSIPLRWLAPRAR